jgi:hypothetical protein
LSASDWQGSQFACQPHFIFGGFQNKFKKNLFIHKLTEHWMTSFGYQYAITIMHTSIFTPND